MTKFIILSYQSEQRKESLALTNPSIQFQLDNFKVARLPTKSIKQKICIFYYDRIFWLCIEAFGHLVKDRIKVCLQQHRGVRGFAAPAKK